MSYNVFEESWMKKYGFTLSEVLITLGILGVLAAIMIPVMRHALPDKIEENHKKATYMIEQTVSQMFTNSSMYPENQVYSAQGFKNTSAVTTVGGKTHSGNTKFCTLFANNFNRLPLEIDSCSVKIPKPGGGELVIYEGNDKNQCAHYMDLYKIDRTVNCKTTGSLSFTSNDGFDWFLPVSNFQDGYAPLTVDVNGPEKPNCLASSTCKKPDRFKYYIRSNGTVTLDEPSVDSGNSYAISVSLFCTDNEENPSECGSVSISGGSFTNLTAGNTYTLTAAPASGYYTNWKDNTKNVKINGYKMNTRVKLRFIKEDKYSINLVVNDCDNSNLSNCVSTTLKYYSSGSIDSGGTLTSVANDCQLVYNSDLNVLQSGCKLSAGDYVLTINPAAGYSLYPEPEEGDLKQPVKLGSEDVTFAVTVQK